MPRPPADYLTRHALATPQLPEPPATGLALVVTIPCHDEPDALGTLASLAECARPDCAVEVLLAVNGSADAPRAVRERNATTVRAARGWARRHGTAGLRFHVLDFPALPPPKAGVGLARKLAMDEAVARFRRAGVRDGVIAALDADCRCSPNYLTGLVNHFAHHPGSPAAAIHFEHDWTGLSDPRRRQGIICYELFLRTHIFGLRYAGHPFAHHTVGSAMAVRASAYAAQGGMNQRRGGEDFYFLNKLMALGNFSEINDITVYPAARASHRVPFGTGRAMTDWLRREDDLWPAYHPQAFWVLRRLLARAHNLPQLPPRDVGLFYAQMERPVVEFLTQADFSRHLAQWQAHSAGPDTFRQRLFRWLDRLRTLKLVHHLRDTCLPPVPVETAAARLLTWLGEAPAPEADAECLLTRFRALARAGAHVPAGTRSGR